MDMMYFNINMIICICGIVVSLTGFATTAFTIRLIRHDRVYFSAVFLLLSLYSGSALTTLLLAGKHGMITKTVFAASNFLEFLIPGVLLFMISIYSGDHRP